MSLFCPKVCPHGNGGGNTYCFNLYDDGSHDCDFSKVREAFEQRKQIIAVADLGDVWGYNYFIGKSSRGELGFLGVNQNEALVKVFVKEQGAWGMELV